ncbi:MAG TPA: enoyl-CoA hydratase, partial [Alphaproteobacteria bacterium]|nr:enoyl-CoA hydratase [Alphaproteobacteria bacterium]
MALSHDRNRIDFASYRPKHFLWSLDGKVARITLNRPERKNP